MSAKVQIELKSSLPQMEAAVRQQLSQAVEALAGDVRDHAVRAIEEGPKTGRVYGAESEVGFTAGKGTAKEKAVSFTAYAGRKLGDDKVHQASAPGEAPATDEGNLAGTIEVVMTGDLTAEIVVPARGDDGHAYGADLEFGTVHMAPRPFLAPAVESARPAFEATVAAAVRKGLRQ